MKTNWVLGLLAVSWAGAATAATEVITPDGRSILLKDDKTWEYLQAAPEEGEDQKPIPALLTVEKRREYADACQFWVRLQNRLPFKVRNLALRFSAFIQEDPYREPVFFDADTRSFSEVKPSEYQYREIFYMNLKCDEIAFIRVEDTGRCSVGELTKFSAQSGDCAKYVDVAASDLVKIFEGQPSPEEEKPAEEPLPDLEQPESGADTGGEDLLLQGEAIPAEPGMN